MSIGERIVIIRGDISQEKFGEKIGLTKASVSRLEGGNRTVTERVISDICREFNVCREWLTTGIGQMENKPEYFSLDEYAKTKNITALELDIIKGYMSLDKEIRKTLLEHFQDVFIKHGNVSLDTLPTLANNQNGDATAPALTLEEQADEFAASVAAKAHVQAKEQFLLEREKGLNPSILKESGAV